jgi:drug/metabolite transporter (DMT)-like permease
MVSGILAVLFAAACWGASGIFVKLIMASGPVSSLCLAFWRDAAAFAVFFALGSRIGRRRIRIPRADWPRLAGMGISLGVFHVALNLGYRLNGAAITTIQQAAMPGIVLVAARIIWKEPLTGIKILSLILIGIGTVLVSGLIQAGAPNVTAGSILVGFLVPSLYAGWSLFGKSLRSGYHAVVILAWAFGIATAILLPFQLFTGDLLPPPLPAISLVWFAGLIGISTVFPFFAFTFALGRLPAGMVSILVMSEIAFAVFYARLVLGEALSPIEIAGALVVVTGVIILLAPGTGTDPVRPVSRR